MKRRRFLVNSAAGLALTAAWPTACTNYRADDKSYLGRNWIWIGPKPERSPQDWKDMFERYVERGINAVLLEVFHGNNAHYESSVLPTSDHMMETAIEAAATAGIELHAWMWTMPCLVPDIVEEHPDWYNVNALGESSSTDPAYVNYYKFLCPSRPESREFIRKRVEELSAFDGLKGVHLDYIRHPDAILPSGLWSKYDLVQDKVYPEFDYCYCEHCREQFGKLSGRDPIEIEDPTSDPEWMQFRWDCVTELVNDHLVPEAKKGGKEISAAVFPGPSIAKEIVRQSWGDWKLDSWLPMLYHNFYEMGTEWIGDRVKEGNEAVGKGNLYSGLFVPGMKDQPEFERSLEVSIENEAAGISLFGMKEEWWPSFTKIMQV